MQKTKTYKMVMCALFAALTAILSQIAIPIGPVPINLATFAVFCAGALLGSKLGALSLAVFVALGAVGVPVFAMFRGGLGALVGPTGGYIIGYIPAAFVTGLIIEKFNKHNKMYLYPVAMLGGMLTYFILGTAWFMFSTNTGLWSSLTICVIPFLPGDFIKIAAATMIAKRLCPALQMSSDNAAPSEDKASKKKWPVITIASISLVIVLFFAFVGAKQYFSVPDFSQIEVGTSRDEILKKFGEPIGSLSGLFGDVYLKNDNVSVTIYYDAEGNVSEVQFSSKDAENTITNNLIGVTLEIKENTLSDIGLTAIVINDSEHDLMFRGHFDVEKKIDGQWYNVPYKILENEVTWTDEGYEVKANTRYEFEPTNWEWLYGALGAGEYRYVKDASIGRDGDITTYYFSVEFALPE